MSQVRRYVQWGCGLFAAAVVALIVVSILFPATANRALTPRLSRAQLIADLGGEQVAAVIGNYDRAEAALVEPPANDKHYEPHEYVVLGKPQPVAAQVAADISHTLLDPNEHSGDSPKSCIPRYGVRLSFFAKADRVDVYFCFECAILEVYLNDKPAGGLSFELPYRRLITDVLKIYPDHQALRERLANWRL